MFEILAQTTQPAPEADVFRLGSISGVIVVTMLVVQYVVKPLLGKVPALNCLPVLVYTAIVAAGLAIFANKVLLTLPGDNAALLAWQAVLSTFAASGLYTALPIGNAATALQPLSDTLPEKGPPKP